MADPHKRKLGELHISARLKDKDGKESDHDFYHLVDAEAIKSAPREQVEKDTAERLKQVSPTPTFGLHRMFTHFSYVGPDALSGFTYANVFVEAHIPYCLHLPNGYDMTVDLPDRKIEGLVTFNKIWTKRAQEDGVSSDDTDFYMADGPVHFQKSTILTPVFPVRPEEGWDQHFTGKNIERMKDQNGTFRYTRLFIEFDPHIPDERLAKLEHLSKEEGEAVLGEISDHALAIVNRVIDCYRFVTRQEYIERLGALSINTIYFKKQNQGFYIMGPVPGIESAVMNRSKKEIEEIERLLKDGEPVPLHDLLILDAHSAFQRKAFTLAIVESFQALEIMLENYLIAAFEAAGVSKPEYEKKLDTNWKTKERLNILLKEVKGHALNENTSLWDPWHTKYDKVRNEVIHQGKQATAKETEDTMKANEAVMAWLLGLS
jgi:hypothetical protein